MENRYDVTTFPEVHNLYFDLNGVIHNASHGNDKLDLVQGSRDYVLLKILHYIDTLFDMVQPTKNLFIGVDGVGPRAKLNQQRQRRFKAGKEKEEALKEGITDPETGEVTKVEKKDIFDSNCITPGTEFMEEVDKALKFFIAHKLNTDSKWKKLDQCVFSGYSVPGEGEHKIMNFIRSRKLKDKNYAANEVHCLYGLDADLIMLSLASHEPYFILLREDVFGRYSPQDMDVFKEKQKLEKEKSKAIEKMKNNAKGRFKRRVQIENEEKMDKIKKKEDMNTQYAVGKKLMFDFELLHVSMVRDYLFMEFNEVNINKNNNNNKKQPYEDYKFDLERLIDDFVLICFFCGNDFLPHIDTLDIGMGAVQQLLSLYKSIVPFLDGYLTENGKIQWKRLKLFLEGFRKIERDILEEKSKKAEKGGKFGKPSPFQDLLRFSHNMDKYTKFVKNEPLEEKNKKESKETEGDTKEITEENILKEISEKKESDPMTEEEMLKDAEKTQNLNVEGMEMTEEDLLKEIGKENEEESKNDYKITNDEGFKEAISLYKGTPEGFQEKGILRGEKGHQTGSRLKTVNGKQIVELPGDFDFIGWRVDYYKRRFNIDINSKKGKEELKKVKKSYLEGMIWNYSYYYFGCISWSWFYPYHYAPLSSDLHEDIIDLTNSIQFTLGTPFTPFQQLLAVLPKFSADLLPDDYRPIMTSSKSELAEFFPSEIKVDMEGCRHDWEGVVIVPFIDQEKLLIAEKNNVNKDVFTPQQIKRNTFGSEVMFFHKDKSSSISPFDVNNDNNDNNTNIINTNLLNEINKDEIESAIGSLPPINNNQCRARIIKITNNSEKIPGLIEGTIIGPNKCLWGFPSLRINGDDEFELRLEQARLKVFQFPSMNISSILIGNHKSQTQRLNEILKNKKDFVGTNLGKRAAVLYPIFREGIVHSISFQGYSYEIVRDNSNLKERIIESKHTREEIDGFNKEIKRHYDELNDRFGLDITNITPKNNALVYLRVARGYQLHPDGKKTTIFSNSTEIYPFPLSLCLLETEIRQKKCYPNLPDEFLTNNFFSEGEEKKTQDFKKGDPVIVFDKKEPRLFGRFGKISSEDRNTVSVDLDPIKDKIEENSEIIREIYKDNEGTLPMNREDVLDMSALCKLVQIHPKVVGNIVGKYKIIVNDLSMATIDIGLNLRDKKLRRIKNEYVYVDFEEQSVDRTYFMNFGVNSSNNFKSSSNFGVNNTKDFYYYTQKTVRLLKEYKKEFPELFLALDKRKNDIYDKKKKPMWRDLFPKNTNNKTAEKEAKKVEEWLSQQDHFKKQFTSIEAQILENEKVKELEKKIILMKKSQKKEKAENSESKMVLSKTMPKGRVLLVGAPIISEHKKYNNQIMKSSGRDFLLGSIVENIRDSGVVPLGQVGIIIGIEGTHIRVLFFEEFLGGDRMKPEILESNRASVIQKQYLLNLTHLFKRKNDLKKTEKEETKEETKGETKDEMKIEEEEEEEESEEEEIEKPIKIVQDNEKRRIEKKMDKEKAIDKREGWKKKKPSKLTEEKEERNLKAQNRFSHINPNSYSSGPKYKKKPQTFKNLGIEDTKKVNQILQIVEETKTIEIKDSNQMGEIFKSSIKKYTTEGFNKRN